MFAEYWFTDSEFSLYPRLMWLEQGLPGANPSFGQKYHSGAVKVANRIRSAPPSKCHHSRLLFAGLSCVNLHAQSPPSAHGSLFPLILAFPLNHHVASADTQSHDILSQATSSVSH